MSSPFFKEQLDQLDGDIKVLFKGEYALVQCPFHKQGQETHPSMMVNLENPRFAEGFCYCMSCGEKGDWNKLAAALGLEELAKGSYGVATNFSVRSMKLEPPQLKEVSCLEVPWSRAESWRGIRGDLINSLSGKLTFNSRTKEKQLILPATVVGEVVGTISCALEKRAKEAGSSYFNSAGPWVRRALFPYDKAIEVCNSAPQTLGCKLPVCIVEGPRDALNLIQHGLPAVAILGTQNWSKASIPLLSMFDSSNYVIMMDGDQAGAKAAETIYRDMVEILPKDIVKVCKLPTAMDPADLKSDVVDWLVKSYIKQPVLVTAHSTFKH